MAKAKESFKELFENVKNDVPTKETPNVESAPQEKRPSRTGGRMVRKTVKVNKIKRNPLNRFNLSEDEKYRDLVKGVERLGEAMEDIICQPPNEDGDYYIISGERRWMALKKAGIEETAIKIIPQRITGSNEIIEIMNANSGRRGDYPYDIPRSLKDLYAMLHAEGVTDKQQQKEIAFKKLNISSERTFRNYHALSELPVDILEAGRSGYITRDEGLALSAALSNENSVTLGEETAALIVKIAASDETTEAKTEMCKKAIAEMKKKLGRREKREAAKKKPNIYLSIKKIGELASIEDYTMPKRTEEKEKMKALIESSIEFLYAVKEKLEEKEKN